MNITRIVSMFAIVAGCFALRAAPVINPANGHLYDAISTPGGITWDDAKAAAEAMGGHLATITSIEENDFIYQNFPEASRDVFFGFWIGGFQPGDTPFPDADPSAGWQWVTGEPFDQGLWSVFGGAHGEPNDCGCLNYLEDAIHLWGNTGAWNDYARDPISIWGIFPIEGFVIEYDDSDGDGILDSDDSCPRSNLSATVVIGDCDSGVPNVLLPGGCTIADRIAECAAGARNHGAFVSCVADLTNQLKNDAVISGADKGKIQSCAAKARVR